ncbi:MAG: MerR family transcriptional regulator [Solirubrobacterales bacterium]|nr:MerR family transcriptional regulator [Solirubrobacterales bacterium]
MSQPLAIRDVAQETGIAAGTLRMWEQRYGYPTPERTDSGYRRYSPDVIPVLRRVVDLRARGLTVPAAIEQARRDDLPTDRPSVYAAIAGGQQPQLLRKATLVAMSRAIEDEAMMNAAAPITFGAFQEQRFYRHVEARWRRMAQRADAVTVFADFDEISRDAGVLQLPIAPQDALGDEWIVVVDAPGYAACLVAWEPERGVERGGPADRDRRFEAIWTVDPGVTRRAAHAAARLVERKAPEEGERLSLLLADRPLAMQPVAPALTALTNRIVAYVEAAAPGGAAASER